MVTSCPNTLPKATSYVLLPQTMYNRILVTLAADGSPTTTFAAASAQLFFVLTRGMTASPLGGLTGADCWVCIWDNKLYRVQLFFSLCPLSFCFRLLPISSTLVLEFLLYPPTDLG